MNVQTHIYTSITSNYLPKARVLAESVKKMAPDAMFHLVLSDDLPAGFDLEQEDFDTIIFAESLPIAQFEQFSFTHSVVELCTAVKGLALEQIFEQYGAERVFYFDPDTVLFSSITALEAALSESSVLLTPHQTVPETTTEAVVHNEICSLKHGVFNLGFVGVRNDKEGRAFSSWWAERLQLFCHDDIQRGLFTDQKWANLAPCFFDRVKILRDAVYNVATWNLTARHATGSLKEAVLINGEPLVFYHFSGMDGGGQENMLKIYGKDSPILFELREWYIKECERHGQSHLGRLPSKYAHFDNGEEITQAHRLLFRNRPDLQTHFSDPFSTVEDGGYFGWCKVNYSSELAGTFGFANNTFQLDPKGSIACALSSIGGYFGCVAKNNQGRSVLKRLFLQFMSSAFLQIAKLAKN